MGRAAKLVAQFRAFGRVGEIGRSHLDGDAVLVGQPGRQRSEHVFASCGDDQMVSARGKFGGQRFADVLRSSGDNGARVRAGSGYWHGPDISVGDQRGESRPTEPAQTAGRASRVVAWALWDCGSTGVGAIVATFVFSVYLTSSVGEDLPGGTSRRVGWAGRCAIAGVDGRSCWRPVIGVWVESPHRRRRTLAVLTAVAVR